MTDFGMMKALLKIRNVPHAVGLKTLYIGYETHGYPETCEEFEGDSAKVDGYYGFYTSIEFNDEGTFVKIGIWE